MSGRPAYEQVLRGHLDRPRALDPVRAGRPGQPDRPSPVGPDELIARHLAALDSLPGELSEPERSNELARRFGDLVEALVAYGMAQGEAEGVLETASREAEEAKFELEKAIVELDLANHQLQDIDRVKTRFFSNMSHELRTPLNAIIGFAEDALDGLAGELNAKQQRFVQNILGAGRHLLTVINEILDLAKLQSGKVSLEPAPFELQALFDALADTMQPLVQRKGQSLVIDDARAFPPIVADRAKLYQILLNLVGNAHKFTPGGGHLAVHARLDAGTLRLEVVDDGRGIPAEGLAHLFEEFRQVKHASASREEGTGLGLAIVKSLVELHGGGLEVKSELDKGSTFGLWIPQPAVRP